MQKPFQFRNINANRLWLRPLEVRKSVSQLLANIVELRSAAALVRVLQFADEYANSFLAYRVARREVEDEEKQTKDSPQLEPR